ncbi:uncharacterized protein LOC103378361 isoform X3 [Cynoglossus semilaevis]|uniref:uncharacterized protein LOC103378361 isoform X3 n=1 Tax=Cynoglossus semilaevis TaxID=244447 RepID=UPI0004968F4C|nr:uncharacterized protein LOC103378361 isoform X3 [Cynoglossus semilaevis]
MRNKFNRGVSVEAKKQTWAEITDQINALGENHREVRQIMKKWADLKCDGKRRIAALRGPNGSTFRKKNLGVVEKMVHKILTMSPKGGDDSDLEVGVEDESTASYSYLSVMDNSHPFPEGVSGDISPLSSPEKDTSGEQFRSSPEFEVDMGEDGEGTMDFDENDDSLFSSLPTSLPTPSSLDPLPDNALMRMKPVHTYSRNGNQNINHIQRQNNTGPTPEASSTADVAASTSNSDATKGAQSVTGSRLTDPATSDLASSSFSLPLSKQPTLSSTPSTLPSSQAATSVADPCDPLPAGASSRRVQDHVSQMAFQSVQQQRASRMLLSSVSQSLEVLAQSVQLLVESQQEFVQESLLLQRETVDILRDFSNTALSMLRDKQSNSQMAGHPAHC